MSLETKQCKGCFKDKEITSFPIRKDRKSLVRRSYCLFCANEIQKARHAAHRKNQPFKFRATKAKARSKTLNVPFNLTPEYLESIWTGFCPILNTEIYLHEKTKDDDCIAELDRYVPEHGYIKGNVSFLSRRANRLKSDMTIKEVAQILKWMEQNERK